MTLITDTATLAAFCARQASATFVTVDTEFVREKTYWPQLCLVQVAGPEEAAAIDPLAPDLSLEPLFDLMANPAILKVFHAARQDVEIFLHITGKVPTPLFDTQIAGMVCGFGDSVSYETLVTKLVGARLDKSSRFTDWSLRPLTDRQLTYALSDVTHLRPVYEKLSQRLERSGRNSWLDEEVAILTDPGTYQADPDRAWMRLRTRSTKPRFRAILREIAAWREREAQARDMPRQRLVRDEALLEIAAHTPGSIDDLARVRSLGRGFAEGRLGSGLLDAVRNGLAVPDSLCPADNNSPEVPAGQGPVIELLRVLLRMKSEQHGVAGRLMASTADIEALANDDNAPVPALKGWRRDLFGNDALALKRGELGLAIAKGALCTVPVTTASPSA